MSEHSSGRGGLVRVVALCAAASLALGQPDPATAATPGSGGLEVDPASGLVIDAGWELVRGHCSACHSARLVIQNRGSRETWLSMIRWMQESQGLWQFDPATEATILDYLSRNYGPMASSRRAPLPSDQLPVNPYARKGAP